MPSTTPASPLDEQGLSAARAAAGSDGVDDDGPLEVVRTSAGWASSVLSDADARGVTAAIGGVEVQHLAVLLLFAARLGEGASDRLRLDPRTVEGLSPEAGGAGAPEPFASTEPARPPAEGAVR